MPAFRRRYRSGHVLWGYQFDRPGSTREERDRISGSGFSTKREAEDAEAIRRVDEQQKRDLVKAGASIAAAPPKTLSTLLSEFIRHSEEKLAPKTVERYREQSAYLDPDLSGMTLTEITPLHLTREWARLLKIGGHTRRTKTPRPLSAKTVRNIAGVVSSAYARAIKWGLVAANPVSGSEPPIPKKHKGMALTPAQQDLLIKAASVPWCLGTFLELSAATGARRGEVLALRWSDYQDGRVTISRSLTQTEVLQFKGTKSGEPRRVSLPLSAQAALNVHRKRQDEFRKQFGPDYRSDLDLIFANPDGTPLKPDSVSASVSVLFRRLKLPKGASLHSLRHSHGSHLLAAGMPLPAVSERLGHSSIRVTADVYSHALRGQDDEAARRWDEFQRQNLPEKLAGGVQ